ncbi:MAG: single-stranded DNA-binding protein [Candidatus Nanopelagicales bacterium]|nr:single-stranded DNA-binding protein [Candidatus Nanopelagicales bacterium]
MADKPTGLLIAPGSRNEVNLIGRMGNTSEQRQLPSGDVIAVFSVVVDRPVREHWGRTKVDTIACQALRPVIIARLALLDPGQWVEVHGVLRRRFWRSGSGLASAMEVEVRKLVRVKTVP